MAETGPWTTDVLQTAANPSPHKYVPKRLVNLC
jgi:hypothetical protein